MTDAASQSPTPAEIVAALERTGFLLEHRAAQKLQNAGFEVIINDAFPDTETGKSRETDIFGMADYEISDISLTISGQTLVECKNYLTPLVLVGRGYDSPIPSIDSVFVSFDPLKLNFPRQPSRSILGTLKLWPVPCGSFTGHQLVRMDRKSGNWGADNSAIYDSILYPLVKARQHELERNKDEYGPGDRNIYGKIWEQPSIIYYFPVLLTAGEVYTVAVGEESEPRVTKVRWATLSRLFHMKDLRTTLHADIVSFEHFDEYIDERIIGTISHASTILAENMHLYNPEWLFANYGRPKQIESFDEWNAAVQAAKSH